MFVEKKVLGIVLTVFAGLFTIGCGNGATEEGNNSDSGEKVQLVIATWANESEKSEFDSIIEDLNSQSDTYVLEQMVIPQDYYTKIQTMIAGNTAPDLMWLSQEYIPAYATNGAVLDITSQLEEQDEIDMSDYLSGSLDTAKYEGATYGLPWIGQPYVLYYNKTMFEEKGVAEPEEDWNWDDFIETARSLTGDGDYGFASTGTIPMAVFAWGEGGEIIDAEGNVKLTDPKTIQGLEIAETVHTDPTVAMPFSEAESLGVEQGFLAGQIGMMVGGANDDIEQKLSEAGDEFEVGMAVIPSGSEEQVTFNWSASTLISSQTENEAVAFEALLDVTNAMFEWKVPSPMSSKMDLIGEINPSKEYALEVIKKSSEISRGFNNLPEQNELGGAQWEYLDLPIISNNNGAGDLDVEEVAENAERQFKSILE